MLLADTILQRLLGQNENPDKGFRGDYQASSIADLTNHGAHAPAVKRLIHSVPQPNTFNAIPISDLNQARTALSRGWLVMAWIPVGLVSSSRMPVQMSDGETVNLVPNEHTIVLHGYDSAGFYVYDPEPDQHLPPHVESGPLAQGMALFDYPALVVQPLS